MSCKGAALAGLSLVARTIPSCLLTPIDAPLQMPVPLPPPQQAGAPVGQQQVPPQPGQQQQAGQQQEDQPKLSADQLQAWLSAQQRPTPADVAAARAARAQAIKEGRLPLEELTVRLPFCVGGVVGACCWLQPAMRLPAPGRWRSCRAAAPPHRASHPR